MVLCLNHFSIGKNVVINEVRQDNFEFVLSLQVWLGLKAGLEGQSLG